MHQYLIGIDVGGTNIKMMIMDETGGETAWTSIPTMAEQGYEVISDNMIRELDRMFEERGIRSQEVAAVGMGLPGTVDKKKNRTVYLAKLRWDDFNPAEKIGSHYHAPSVIDNDANVNALGEYRFGTDGNVDSLALLTLGTGVGCGFVVNGKIFGGFSNMAAEAGHMIVAADGGAICLCGKRGHLEGYCSGTALERNAREMMEARKDSLLVKYVKENKGVYDNSMVTRGVREGDETCQELWKHYIHYLSAGITNVMLMYNPEVILLGGGISAAGELLLEPVNRETSDMVLHKKSWCPVRKAALGSRAGMYGACALAAQEAEIRLPFGNKSPLI